jgi:lipoyl(octanoyl) transferase
MEIGGLPDGLGTVVYTECVVYNLGLVPYEQAWQMQDQMASEIAVGKRPATLLLLEHPHTYTFGRSGKVENLLWDEAELERRGISVHWVDRGGDVTYHGPGQLVGYPLLPLGTAGLQIDPSTGSPRLPQADYVGYIRKLEIALIQALAHFEVESVQIPGLTGVWVPAEQRAGLESSRRVGGVTDGPEIFLPSKIAAIGVKVDARGVSRHGFSLNVNPDMSYWEGIIGCGLANYPVTSLAELAAPAPAMGDFVGAVIETFGEIFHYRMINTELEKPGFSKAESV